MKSPITIVTHSGSFHADDVCAVATLRIALGDAETRVIRTRDEKVIAEADYVVDVGGAYDPKKRRFDHHQVGGGGVRPNKIPYASFGLVWKAFGKKVCGSDPIAAMIDEKMVQSIDAIDNGIDIIDSKSHVYPYLFGHAISAFLPSWKEAEKEGILNKSFRRALDFAQGVISREIVREKDKVEGQKFVRKAYEKAKDKRVIIFDKNYAWGDVLNLYPEPLFAIYPQRPNWHVKAVRDNMRSFKNRIDFPRMWAGKRGADLAKVTGVADALFCHSNRFLAVAKSREGAIRLAELALRSS